MSSKPGDLVVIDNGPFIIFCIATVCRHSEPRYAKCIVLYTSGSMRIENWGPYLSSAGMLIAGAMSPSST